MSTAKTLLEGYRVLDLTDEKGLLASRMLADMGAEVIKVEKPGGDEARRIGPFYKDQVNPEQSLFWFAVSMNKKSITLDITRREGQEILKRLVPSADFLFESSPPGTMEGLGLGYPQMSRLNERLVYVSISPFGQSGPYRDFRGPDIVVWALSGFLHLCGNRERAPVRFSYPLAYFFASGEAAISALIAHHHRAISGEGQWVDTSAQHACVWPTMDSRIMWEIFRQNQERAGGNRWRTMPKGVLHMRLLYPCRDGFVQLYIWGGKLGEGSNKALDAWMREEGMDTSHLKKYGWPALDMTQVAPGEYGEITSLGAEFIRPRAKQELYEGAVQRGIMMAPVSTFQDVWQNRQLEARGFWVDVPHEELSDTLRYPGRWALLTETPLNRWNRAPRIGEHNREIYRGELQMTQADIEHLAKLGVI